jgi:hypothetical protein|tara:strand:- start:3936 stop:4310 length:375 start_codon:yes stop_codon:yes gene_type:complete
MLTALIPAVSGILDKFIPDADTKQKLSHQISTMAEKHHQELMLAQIKVNEAEAKGNWFQSSWRPLTGYVCVLGFMVNFLVSPICAGFGIIIPQADTATMLPVLMGMLGLGSMRTVERIKGKDKK